jgi:hypothetical protein
MSRSFQSLLLVSGLALAVACGSDDGTEGDAQGQSGSAGTGSTTGAGQGGSKAGGGDEGGAPDSGGSAGTGTAGKGGSTAGSAGRGGGGAGGSTTGGSAGADDGSGGADFEPPPPTEDGTSIYTVECEGDSVVCNYPAAHCLGIYLDEGGVGYACSNQCETVADCSDAPSGSEAKAGCVQFSAASRCVLVCHDNGTDYECPDGMGCYQYPNSPIGYCLYL